VTDTKADGMTTQATPHTGEIRVDSGESQSVCIHYEEAPPHFDEMQPPGAAPQRHWQAFLSAMSRLGCDELERRRQDILRQLRQNGTAYNIHGTPQGVYREWELDIVPLIISREDFENLEAGLSQRARLLSRILEDIYGPQETLRKGIIPPELILDHPGYLRPCRHMPQRGLVLYAADLVRTADGRFQVLYDHTQNPAGMGFALENRTVLAGVMPDFFRDCRVRRLSNFFRALRDTVSSLNTRTTDASHIVMLTPGPRNDGYFDHAYLGTYLGYAPVLADDLSVRDGHLHLKALEGLKRVDIVFRQTHDYLCDPLELGPSGTEGVAGLLEVTRRGNAAMANPLGSGVLENPGLMPFLPRLCTELLGEPLRLPSVETFWCGRRDGQSHVASHMADLLIKATDVHEPDQPAVGGRLSIHEREAWRQRIAAAPHRYAGQVRLEFATSPSLKDNRLVPLPTRMRTFLVAQAGGGFFVMPGGIARSAPADRAAQSGMGILKDVWVIASQPERHVSLWLHARREGGPVMRQGVMPSRVAENLFWAGRYVERAEAMVRMLLTVLRHRGENDAEDDDVLTACLRRLTGSLEDMTLGRSEGVDLSHDQWLASMTGRIRKMVQDRTRPGSLSATMSALLNAAQNVREHWSSDMWRVINLLKSHGQLIDRSSEFTRHRIAFDLEKMINALLAFSGLCMDSMSREPGWVLLDTGRRIERSLMIIDFLRRNLVPVYDPPLDGFMMESVLMATDNIVSFRRRYRAVIYMDAVLDLLLMDDRNPRSLLYQIERLQEHISGLPKAQERFRMSEQERLILKAGAQLKLSHVPRMAEPHAPSATHRGLESLLIRIKTLLEKTSVTLTQAYFIHTQPSRQLVDGSAESQG